MRGQLESYELKLKDSMKTIKELRDTVDKLENEIRLRDKYPHEWREHLEDKESYQLKLTDLLKIIKELRLEIKELTKGSKHLIIMDLEKEIELLYKFTEKLKKEIKLRDKILQKFTAGLPVDYIKAYNDLQATEYSRVYGRDEEEE